MGKRRQLWPWRFGQSSGADTWSHLESEGSPASRGRPRLPHPRVFIFPVWGCPSPGPLCRPHPQGTAGGPGSLPGGHRHAECWKGDAVAPPRSLSPTAFSFAGPGGLARSRGPVEMGDRVWPRAPGRHSPPSSPAPSPGSHTYGPRLEMWAPGLGGVGSSAEAPPVHAGGRSEACIFLACDWQNPLLTEGSGSPPETKCTLKPAACAALPRGRWVCAVSPRGAPPLMDCIRRPPRMRLPSERRPRVCPVRVLWGRHGMCWKP